MTKTTMSNATINSIKSSCNPRDIYNLNRIICADGIHPDDMKAYIRNSDGMLMDRPRVSKHERERIVELLKAGYTCQKVCEMTHRSDTTIEKIKKEAGLTKPRQKKPADNNQLETAIIVMRNHGVKPKQIADLLDLDVFYVYRVVKKGKKRALASSNK